MSKAHYDATRRKAECSGPIGERSGHPLDSGWESKRCRKVGSALAPHRSVAGGFGLRHLTPRAQVGPHSTPRPSLPRFSGPHALRAHRLLARGRCLPRIQYCSPRAGGKELCPLRTTRGSGDAAARSRRGAPPRSSRAASCQGQSGREGEGRGLSLVPD
jgi:hypothetical protein